jgi:hypothetical protein
MSSQTIRETFHFVTKPSLVEGMARVLDLGSTLQAYKEHKNSAEANFEALKKDWKRVGEDIKISIGNYEQKQKTTS